MLMKLTAGVNFINILINTYFYESILRTFSPLSFVVFLAKKIGEKAARKMLMKLTTGLFTFEKR